MSFHSFLIGLNWTPWNLILEKSLNKTDEEIEPPKDKFIEFKLATVLRDKVETEIPSSSTIDKKNSNIFGLINNQLKWDESS